MMGIGIGMLLMMGLMMGGGGFWGMGKHKGDAHDFPHAFLLPKGIPDRPGSYNLQLSPFTERKKNDTTNFDVGAHASMGMFDWGGIHLRNLGIKTTPTTEIIGMVALKRDRLKQQGISLIAILGIPTNNSADTDDEHRHNNDLSYLLGLTGRLVFKRNISLDTILHYDFTEEHFIPETGLVWRTSPNLFAVLDSRAVIGENTEVYLLPGIKYRFSPSTVLGLGYRFPVSSFSKFKNQIYFQLEIGRH